MEIIDFEGKYSAGVKSLLKELQEYIVSIDPYGFNIIKEGYEESIFIKDMNLIDKNSGKMYLAVENDKVIGLIIGIIRKPEVDFDYEKLDDMGEVIELIVTKNTRSKGIGKQLLLKMETYFKEQDCKTINIDVFGYNDLAKDFYYRNGYHNRMITVSKKLDE